MPELFNTELRALRRDRAARSGPELFLFDRIFEECLERIALANRQFDRALLIGCPDPRWPERLGKVAKQVDVRDPGRQFAARVGGVVIVEDAWEPPKHAYDLVLAIGSLETVNDLPLALRLIEYAMRPEALFIGTISGGDTLPRLRSAMRAADTIAGIAAPHVHPRIEPSALSTLLTNAGFVNPVVDVERINLAYRSMEKLVGDLRAMGATNVLRSKAPPLSRAQREAAIKAFASSGEQGRTTETFELIHFAAWSAQGG
jgi:hypothetical protein